ncbi:MAG: hypothetical protein AB8G96_07785 [Phycisphaerales bacterium]
MRLTHVRQLTRPRLDRLFELAELIRGSMRAGDQSFAARLAGRLSGRSAVLAFSQPSTRTFVSCSLAARATGLVCEEMRGSETSSRTKGETELDTFLTLANLADAIILRHHDPGLIERLAYELTRRQMPTRLLNAGSGPDQHPTQALLDVFTLNAHLDLRAASRQITVGMVGDLRRGRAARSLSHMLSQFPNVRQVFIAPDGLHMSGDVTDALDTAGVEWSRTDDLDEMLPSLDAVYMVRLQDEYEIREDEAPVTPVDMRLSPERTAMLPAHACILHPLPRRGELPLEVDDDPRARHWEAVERGKWVRAALLLHQFGCDDPSALSG